MAIAVRCNRCFEIFILQNCIPHLCPACLKASVFSVKTNIGNINTAISEFARDERNGTDESETIAVLHEDLTVDSEFLSVINAKICISKKPIEYAELKNEYLEHYDLDSIVKKLGLVFIDNDVVDLDWVKNNLPVSVEVDMLGYVSEILIIDIDDDNMCRFTNIKGANIIEWEVIKSVATHNICRSFKSCHGI